MPENTTARDAGTPPNAAVTGTPTLERKTMEFEVKELDGDSGGFTLYAAAYGNVDKSGEKIAPSAFKNLPEFVQDGFFALNHDWKALPIGSIDNAESDSYGLKLTGRFHSHPEAQAARTVMLERKARGKSVKCSIGYVVTDDARMVENGKAFRLLKGINLFEASMVSVPANDLAHVVSVKSADDPTPDPDPATPPEAAPDPPEAKATESVSTKGALLGDTDEAMACAAFGRLHDVLGYYVHAQIYRLDDPAEVAANVGAAVDEYKGELLRMLAGVLIPGDAEAGEGAAESIAMTDYGYRSARADHLATKHVHSLLHTLALNHDTSREGAVTALALEDRSKALASDVAGLLEVHRKHLALRVKEGRTLSTATRTRIKAVLDGISPLVDDLNALLGETEPKPKDEGKAAEVPTEKSADADAVTSLSPVSLRNRHTRLKIRAALMGVAS